MKKIMLKPGREKSILRCHPWIFSGAIDRVEGSPQSGETVAVVDANGNSLAQAAYSPQSNIRARIWSWQENEVIGEDFLRKKVIDAIELRNMFIDEKQTNAMRLIHAESDGLPGIIVDRYADFLVLQCLSAGADVWRDMLVPVLCEVTGCKNVYERSDVEVRNLEGLPQRSGVLAGAEPGEVKIFENGNAYLVDVVKGQKTGFYLDQRSNRQRLGRFAAGKCVLNCFCYTGGFSVTALAAGAGEVVSVDSSAEALQAVERHIVLNRLDAKSHETVEGDVFQVLRDYRDRGRSFDVIVLDPPKFAPTAAQAEKAARGYKDINLLAFKMLNPGGLLFTFSCSGGISAELFQKIVAGAALDAGVQAVVVERLAQDADHPVALHFPEGAYLKGLVCRRQN